MSIIDTAIAKNLQEVVEYIHHLDEIRNAAFDNSELSKPARIAIRRLVFTLAESVVYLYYKEDEFGRDYYVDGDLVCEAFSRDWRDTEGFLKRIIMAVVNAIHPQFEGPQGDQTFDLLFSECCTAYEDSAKSNEIGLYPHERLDFIARGY